MRSHVKGIYYRGIIINLRSNESQYDIPKLFSNYQVHFLPVHYKMPTINTNRINENIMRLKKIMKL